MLNGIGYIHPAVDEQTCQQRKPSTDAFNNAVKAKAIYDEELSFLWLFGTLYAKSTEKMPRRHNSTKRLTTTPVPIKEEAKKLHS